MGPYDVATGSGNVDLREIIGGKFVAYLDAAQNRLRTWRACGATEYYDAGTCKQCDSGKFSVGIEDASCQSCSTDSLSTWACGSSSSPYVTANGGSTEHSLVPTAYTPPAPAVTPAVIPTRINFIQELGSLTGEMNLWDGVLAAGSTFVLFNLAVQYVRAGSSLPPVFYAYLGNFLVATTAELAAAYALIHIMEATAPVTGSNYFTTYGGKTTLGDYLGAWQLAMFLAYGSWAAVLSLAGNYLAVIMWLNIDEYENTKTHVNRLTSAQGYKYLTAGIIIALGGWISALGIGEQAEKLFSIFDAYNTSTDTTGSALYIDAGLHSIGAFLNFVVLTTVAAGGYMVGIAILGTELNFSQGVSDLSNEQSTYLQDLKKQANL